MIRTVVSSSFQIRIPPAIAAQLGLTPGDYVDFRVIEGGRVVLEKAREERLAGAGESKAPPRAAQVPDEFRVAVRMTSESDDQRNRRRP